MSKGFYGLTAFVGFIILVLGIWLTIVAFEEKNHKWVEKIDPKWNKKILKIAGPIMIGLGFILLVGGGMNYGGSGHHKGGSSNFGFKFY
jgi:uncharacterized membrane protein